MRAMNPSEQYVHDRLAVISAANPNPFHYSAGAAAFLEELAKVCGHVLGESDCPKARDRFVAYLSRKFDDVVDGVPQQVRLTPAAPAEPSEPVGQLHLASIEPPSIGSPGKWAVSRLVDLLQEEGSDGGPQSITGAELKAARLKKGWFQDDVAEAIGLPQGYISLLERDKRVGVPGLYPHLRKVLDIPLAVTHG
jgi:hypothetical protein